MLEPDFIIQSRLSSNRLPFKAALNLSCGNASVKAVIKRCELIKKKLGLNNRIFVACPEDEVFIYKNLCQGTDVEVFGGASYNVADRINSLLGEKNRKSFIRVTGDNPYICLDVVEYLLSLNEIKHNLCVSLYHQRKLPNGTVISFITKKFLEIILKINCPQAVEHLVISNNRSIIKQISIPKIPNHLVWPDGRFCLDDSNDYKYLFSNPKINNLFTVNEMKTNLCRRSDVREY